MTTILADARLGLMVADSNVSDKDRVWKARKVYRVKGALVGLAGDVVEAMAAIEWLRSGGRAPAFKRAAVLVLDADGLRVYNGSDKAERITSGREAIGSGAKAAMCAYEALGFSDPRRAVSIVCKHDAGSRGPVRAYKL